MDRPTEGILLRLEHLNRLLAGPKWELIPLKGALDQAAFLPPGATVTITASPKRGPEPTLDLAEQLAQRGFSVVPHLAAHTIRDRVHLEQILARIAAAGIRRAFVVGGDGAEPGEYPDALSLLRAIRDSGWPFDEVGIAGYPERHPRIPAPALLEALREKAPHASYVTTQMCFDARAIARWVESIRAAGITLPVHLGLPGAVDPARLLSISARIGVGESMRYLRKNRGVLGWLLPWRRPNAGRLLAELGPPIGDPAVGIERVHLFTFNQVEATVAWWRAFERNARYIASASE